MANSRLSRREVRQSKKKLIYSLGGIIIVLFLLVKFGIPLLTQFSLLVAGRNQTNDGTQNTDKPRFIAPPVLNQPFTATNSAQIKVSGTAQNKQQVKLYVNDNVVDTQDVQSDGTFSFENVTLKNGDNTIQAKAKMNDKESDFSNTLTITFQNKAPSLDVSSPSDGQSFSKDPSLVVKGKTDPDAKVTVNDFQAIVNDDGSFSYNMQLQNGDNQLKVIAMDAAGNKTEKDLKVTYTQ